jgi:hypothetical protein
MKRNNLRRRFSLALPALVFLVFTVIETVEIETVAETIAAMGIEDTQSKSVVPAAHVDKAIHCPNTACEGVRACRLFTDA